MLVLDRSFVGPVDAVDGDLVVGRVVPWSTPAKVTDLDDQGRLDRYVEQFHPGAFDRQIAAGRSAFGRIPFQDDHVGGYGKVGHTVDLDSRDDGLWGTFRLSPHLAATVRQQIDDGIDGLSIRFHPLPNGDVQDRSGQGRAVTRTAAYLVHVALVAVPAYADARVLVARSAGEDECEWDAALAGAEAAASRSEYASELSAWLADTASRGEAYRARLRP